MKVSRRSLGGNARAREQIAELVREFKSSGLSLPSCACSLFV
jgi:hypothetical protein